MPKSVQRWVLNLSTSTNVPGSRSRSTRSRAVSLPAACCFLMRSSPPPSSASWLRRASSSRFSLTPIPYPLPGKTGAYCTGGPFSRSRIGWGFGRKSATERSGKAARLDPVARPDTMAFRVAGVHLEHALRRGAARDRGRREGRRVLGDRDDSPVFRDVDDVERERRVLHPERARLLLVEQEQHAGVRG